MWFLQQRSLGQLRRRVGALQQVAGIDRFCEEDGPARGARRYQVRSGSGLVVDVLPDRALDLGAASFRGMPLAWVSAAGHRAPALVEQHGSDWLRSFGGGLLTTCGLDQFGAPNTDDGQEFGLHGRASGTPAHEVNTRSVPTADGCHFEVSGRLRQARLFGENLLLARSITTELGSSTLTVTDTVTNDGFAPQPHMLLYHMNLGWPLLSETSVLSIPGSTPVPRDEDAAHGVATWDTFAEPQDGFAEQVFRHTFRTPGPVQARLTNPDLGLSLSIRFDTAELPGLFQWKMLGAGEYVLGIEPANCTVINGRHAAREADALPVLQPGESRSYTIHIEVTTD